MTVPASTEPQCLFQNGAAVAVEVRREGISVISFLLAKGLYSEKLMMATTASLVALIKLGNKQQSNIGFIEHESHSRNATFVIFQVLLR